MIALTDIAIFSTETIVEFRNKLLSLLPNLGFKDMESTRIVTQISDFSHHISFQEKSFNIKIGFEKSNHVTRLVIIFDNLTIPLETLKKFCNFFEMDFFPHKEKAGGKIHLQLFIPNKNFKIDENNLLKLKEKLIVQSKAELTREIVRKNEELNKLVRDLKNSANLIQSEKMRALGVLTAGVAHELNNPMMGILNFIQYCIKKTSKDDGRYGPLKDAEREVKRCIDIVTNLLTFSHLEKEAETALQPVNMSLLVKRVIGILSYRLRSEKIEVDEEIADNIPSIMGHENRLQQVILNLVSNALDAMKNSKKKQLGIKIHYDNENVKIILSDTGEGMDEETKRKIFEPFFTTKPTGLGTGLGLSVSENIIKEHKGRINCYSEKNKGTKFYITLPL